MAVVLGKSLPDYKAKNILVDNPENLTGEYLGYSESFENDKKAVIIRLKKKKLNYCIGGYCEPMYHMGDDKFWLKSFPYDFIEFERDQQGKGVAIREFYYGFFQVYIV